MSSPYLQALINWRKQQGYEVNLVSTNETGNSTTAIRNYIVNVITIGKILQNISALSEMQMEVYLFLLTMFLLVEVVVVLYGESDYPYTLIEDDLLPEIIVGRISVRSSTELLATVVQKIIGYEKAYGGIGDWISTAALVGDPYDSGISKSY